MHKKITPEVDQQIILALAVGEPNKDIAERFGVSKSYISKVKTGKKVPSIKFIEPALIKDEFFEVDTKPLTDLIVSLNINELIIDPNKSILEYLETQMKKCLIQAKMYQILIDKLKEKK